MARRIIDWLAIENEYCNTAATASSIAKKHNISHTIVNRKVKNEGWFKTFEAGAKKKKPTLLLFPTAPTSKNESSCDRELSGKELKQSVVRDEQSTIDRFRTVSDSLLAELEFHTHERHTVAEFAEALRDGSSGDVTANIIRRIMSLDKRVETFAKAVQSLKLLVDIERKVYMIDEPDEVITDAQDNRVIFEVIHAANRSAN